MELVLCRYTALELWRALGDRAPRPASSRPNLHSIPPPDLGKVDLRVVSAILPSTHQLEVLAGEAKSRRRAQGLKVHVWSADTPQRSFARLSNDVQLSSPEFVFLQLASEYAFYDLVKLGFELCGTYALAPKERRGFASRRNPLTTPEKIEAFLDKCSGTKGVAPARRAVSHIIGGSASPMETALAMILSLPIRYGGYGFPKPILNGDLALELDVVELGRKRVRNYRCDLLWLDAPVPLAIEYESDSEHLSSWKFGEDSVRRNDLVSTDITVLTVTKRQILNLAHWPVLAAQVSSVLRYKPRIRVPDHRERQGRLYARLFGSLFSEG